MSIGLRIRELRTKQNLSQDEFAASVGIKRANLGQIEIGNQLPTLKILSNIVKIYHTTYTFLIDGEYNESQEGSTATDSTTNYNVSCPRCRDKERIIDLLEEKVEQQKQKISSLEKGPVDKKSNYSQTA
jgi:transcriptional regulator with XRE-family HTH domain